MNPYTPVAVIVLALTLSCQRPVKGQPAVDSDSATDTGKDTGDDTSTDKTIPAPVPVPPATVVSSKTFWVDGDGLLNSEAYAYHDDTGRFAMGEWGNILVYVPKREERLVAIEKAEVPSAGTVKRLDWLNNGKHLLASYNSNVLICWSLFPTEIRWMKKNVRDYDLYTGLHKDDESMLVLREDNSLERVSTLDGHPRDKIRFDYEIGSADCADKYCHNILLSGKGTFVLHDSRANKKLGELFYRDFSPPLEPDDYLPEVKLGPSWRSFVVHPSFGNLHLASLSPFKPKSALIYQFPRFIKAALWVDGEDAELIAFKRTEHTADDYVMGKHLDIVRLATHKPGAQPFEDIAFQYITRESDIVASDDNRYVYYRGTDANRPDEHFVGVFSVVHRKEVLRVRTVHWNTHVVVKRSRKNDGQFVVAACEKEDSRGGPCHVDIVNQDGLVRSGKFRFCPAVIKFSRGERHVYLESKGGASVWDLKMNAIQPRSRREGPPWRVQKDKKDESIIRRRDGFEAEVAGKTLRYQCRIDVSGGKPQKIWTVTAVDSRAND